MTEPRPPGKLRLYFTVPSGEGFSPYRTGAGLHVALSVLFGGGAYAAATVLAGATWWAGGVAALVVVVALWGVGWKLGVASHYVFMPAGTLGMAAVALVVVFAGRPAVEPVVAGIAAHFVARMVIALFSRR